MARAFSDDLNKRTVDNILQIYVQWGTVINLWQKPPGRHKTLTQNEMKILRELITKDKVDWYLDELVGELEQQTGKLVSIPTL
ncbi:hypothetical protein RhiirA5_507947 [Rhizophagus irregularis]|uniref:Uncharacterized protein n=1 Tax=Rhizophagus irregularis TaxID=588596 RepID=A0A2I1FM28_9GLOM|nr:hypothetical protein RhiirA5_507947 [Rhizophagus irregularis]PKC50572.1 hypothetical protein RhiirA1_543843 [Rhizophagus irregularis]PKY35412.1 hypothetical protein RhiirB3_533172 [Rhizophagus irregularis]